MKVVVRIRQTDICLWLIVGQADAAGIWLIIFITNLKLGDILDGILDDWIFDDTPDDISENWISDRCLWLIIDQSAARTWLKYLNWYWLQLTLLAHISSNSLYLFKQLFCPALGQILKDVGCHVDTPACPLEKSVLAKVASICAFFQGAFFGPTFVRFYVPCGRLSGFSPLASHSLTCRDRGRMSSWQSSVTFLISPLCPAWPAPAPWRPACPYMACKQLQLHASSLTNPCT